MSELRDTSTYLGAISGGSLVPDTSVAELTTASGGTAYGLLPGRSLLAVRAL